MFPQISAVLIFVVMFLLIVAEKIERHLITLGCGLLTLVVVFGIGLRSPEAIWEALSMYSFANPNFWHQSGEATTSVGINWETICFLSGMMIMVEGMAESGFFRWLCMTLAKLVHFRIVPLFLALVLPI